MIEPQEKERVTSETTKVKNILAWLLAFAPIIGEFIRGIILFAIYGDSYMIAIYRDELWYITLIMNVGLGILDEKYLDKSSVDTSKFKMWSALIPVYLYQRSKILGHNYAYFITWCVSFLVILLF